MTNVGGSHGRVRGLVLGAALGDALGFPLEFLSRDQIIARHGAVGVTGPVLSGGVARYSDDTQMAEIVLRALVKAWSEGQDLDATMTDMAAGFAAWAEAPLGGHRAPGGACLAGARALAAGVPWREAGGASAGGCGSVMRAYPFGLMARHAPLRALSWAVAHSSLTHRAPLALAACAGMTAGVAAALADATPDAIVDQVIAAARSFDLATAAMLTRAAEAAVRGAAPEPVLEGLPGWAAHEALAAALFVFRRHPDDFVGAVCEAVNVSGDSDSVGTLAGALVGARLGEAALPPAWVAVLERSAELLALADAAADAFAQAPASLDG